MCVGLYSTPGKRTVVLTVTDAGAMTSTKTVVITVTAPAVLSETLSPTSGYAGSTVKVSATGFGGGEVVRISWDQTVVSSPKASAAGGLSRVAVKVPTGATRGVHTISLLGATSGRTVSKPFTVN